MADAERASRQPRSFDDDMQYDTFDPSATLYILNKVLAAPRLLPKIELLADAAE
jgi:hypothetical protein